MLIMRATYVVGSGHIATCKEGCSHGMRKRDEFLTRLVGTARKHSTLIEAKSI